MENHINNTVNKNISEGTELHLAQGQSCLGVGEKSLLIVRYSDFQ